MDGQTVQGLYLFTYREELIQNGGCGAYVLRVEFNPRSIQLSMQTGKQDRHVFCPQTLSVSGRYPSNQRISLAIQPWSLVWKIFFRVRYCPCSERCIWLHLGQVLLKSFSFPQHERWNAQVILIISIIALDFSGSLWIFSLKFKFRRLFRAQVSRLLFDFNPKPHPAASLADICIEIIFHTTPSSLSLPSFLFDVYLFMAVQSLICGMQAQQLQRGLGCSTACGILVPRAGIVPSLALEGEFLTTGPPGKSVLLLSCDLSIIAFAFRFSS